MGGGRITAARPTGPAPHTTALQWAVSDANGDTLTCALDLDGNGWLDLFVPNGFVSAERPGAPDL